MPPRPSDAPTAPVAAPAPGPAPGPAPAPALGPALGHTVLDRGAHLRAAGWPALGDVPRRLVLLDREAHVAAAQPHGTGWALATVAAATSSSPARTPDGPAPDDPATTGLEGLELLLGIDPAGVAICARVVERTDPLVPQDAEWVGLRQVGLQLDAVDRDVLAEATALVNWHRTHPHCPRCGQPTVVAGMGWWRTCPTDGSDHYPRTDPAVIALLIDAGDAILLGRQARWPEGAFSTLAGFVEPGESAEAAVVREIEEEVGLRPTTSTYVASQPWPFPASLMLGYHAWVDGTRPTAVVDGTEIVEARWVDRAELAQACAARDIRLPGGLSIAHHLITRWFGRPLPPEWCRW